MASTKVVSREEYREARLDLLSKEKEATRLNDALSAQRRNLPIIEVTKDYKFTTILRETGEESTISLLGLFEHRRQLIVYHFMFDPTWDAGCISCSLMADHIPSPEHLNARDTSMVCVSRAPIAKIEAYKKRMGWKFPWVSSYGSDFNYDFHITMDAGIQAVQYNFKSEDELKRRGMDHAIRGEQPGISCFVRGGGKLGIGEEGKVYHTYSAYARGVEKPLSTFTWLDLTPFGRQGENSRSPADKRRDEYTAEDLRGTA